MSIRILLPALVLFICSCNNGSGEKEDRTGKDTNTAANMGHDHPSPAGDVPALPDVPKDASINFGNLEQGAEISSPFKLKMSVEGIRIDTAGPILAGSGHHHLFIEAEDSLAAGTVVPKDVNHIHFGKGQTEYELTLTPGKHKLTLQFADGLHRSYGSRLSRTISIRVK
jgi:hypothetical protein